MAKEVNQNVADDLDSILDDALDDFEDEEEQEQKAETDNSNLGELLKESQAHLTAAQSKEMENLQENMAKFLEDAQNPEFQSVLEQAFRELNSEDAASGESVKTLLGSLSNSKNNNEGETKIESDQTDVSVGVAKTLQGLAQAAEDMEGMDTSQAEQMGEDMMADMMKKFEQMGEKSDFQGVVDGMMQQLLSKDVMYEPMKQICEKYPEWLAEKEPHLSVEDYERYGKQYQYFQQIVAVYDTEPDNFARLSELMQDMQECGQPPSEIVKELAPGLEFDDEGMPILPNMGPGMMPGMSGVPGMPVGPQVPGQEQCCLM